MLRKCNVKLVLRHTTLFETLDLKIFVDIYDPQGH